MIAVAGQAIVLHVAHATLGIALPIGPIEAVIAAVVVFAALTAARLGLEWPPTEVEVALQLLVDIGALTALLYLGGGATNPFASLYLVPIALAAVGLHRGYAIAIASVCIAAYVLLMRFFIPLQYPGYNAATEFNLHLWGMAVNFAISALLLTVFLIVMNSERRAREQDLAQLREDTLRHEHLSAIGLLAAGAAHELSTPLSTMAILASELKRALPPESREHADVDLLQRQIRVCKERLNRILRSSGQERAPETRPASVRAVVLETLDAWRVVHPAARVAVTVSEAADTAIVRIDEGFAQALVNVLTNAMQASHECGSPRIAVSLDVRDRAVTIVIDDEGNGIDASLRNAAGRSIVSDKSDGFGLGLVLSNANLARLGGELTLSPRAGGGTRTTIRLPLAPSEAVA